MMKALNHAMISLYVTVSNGWKQFTTSERGDTNFVSMILIIAIALVAAAALSAIIGNEDKGLMHTIKENLEGFVGDSNKKLVS